MAVKHVQKNSTSPVAKKSLIRRVMKWMGWAIVYLVVFYLGNLTGEYVAAQMPIFPSLPKLSFHTSLPSMPKLPTMPKILLPKLSVAWNASKWSMNKTDTSPAPASTKLVVIAGNFINMPLAGATAAEKDRFVQQIQGLSVAKGTLTVRSACEISPAFIKTKQKETIIIVSASSQSYTIGLNTQPPQRLDANQRLNVTVDDAKGIYPISCDGQISGFYTVED